MASTGVFPKAIITSFFAAISIRLNGISDLLTIFVLAIFLDYFTGILQAIYNHDLNSKKGLKGVVKKTGEFLIVTVALLCDEIVAEAAQQIGFDLTIEVTITSIVLVWLILNELISILENIARLNIDLPPFLMSMIRLLKQQTESRAKTQPLEDEQQKPKQDNL